MHTFFNIMYVATKFGYKILVLLKRTKRKFFTSTTFMKLKVACHIRKDRNLNKIKMRTFFDNVQDMSQRKNLRISHAKENSPVTYLKK